MRHTKATYKLLPEFKEKNSGELVTVPDEAYTVKELFEKYRTGQPVATKVMEHGGYKGGTEDFDAPDLEALGRMELDERQAFQESLGEEMLEKEKQIKDYEKERARISREEREELDSLRKELKARKEKSSEESDVKATKRLGSKRGATEEDVSD